MEEGNSDGLGRDVYKEDNSNDIGRESYEEAVQGIVEGVFSRDSFDKRCSYSKPLPGLSLPKETRCPYRARFDGVTRIGRLQRQLEMMDELVERMCDSESGIQIRDERSFMTKTPSVFTGAAVVSWLQTNLDLVDLAESQHLAHMIAAHGYIFPIDDHILTVRNDGGFYRFQTKLLWPTRCSEAKDSDYAAYLCKRAIQNKSRTALVEYEMENLQRLQSTMGPAWQYVIMKAEEMINVEKRRAKTERKILESQERAFWDLHRPAPGCVNTTEVDRRKLNRMKPKNSPLKIAGCPDTKGSQEESLTGQVGFLKRQLERRRPKASKTCEQLKSHAELYAESDPTQYQPEQGNPWISDSTELWESAASNTAVPYERCARWQISIMDLLNDPAGQHQFHNFLRKEVSAENLEFWLDCREVKRLPISQVSKRVAEIYQEYLAAEANNPVNVDAQVAEKVRKNTIQGGSRHSLDPAEEHIFNLMKTDSYARFIRSEQYKEYVSSRSKPKGKSNPLS